MVQEQCACLRTLQCWRRTGPRWSGFQECDDAMPGIFQVHRLETDELFVVGAWSKHTTVERVGSQPEHASAILHPEQWLRTNWAAARRVRRHAHERKSQNGVLALRLRRGACGRRCTVGCRQPAMG